MESYEKTKITVSDIQHFSLGDGPGIRTTVFLKGCNLACPWCHNPETQSFHPQILRYASRREEKLCGRVMMVKEILGDIMQDADFYASSGGGVTLSGGEPLCQPEGAVALAEALHRKGIHVLVDTGGNVPFSVFDRLMPFVDEYYFDWKACNEKDYAAIGGNYSLIFSNLCRLVSRGKNITARIPLIPEFNSNGEYSVKMCNCLREAGIKRVGLLPFHRLGSGKYTALGRVYAYRDIPPMDLKEAETIAQIYKKYFDVYIEK